MELISAFLYAFFLICTFACISPILFLITYLQGQTLRHEMHQSFKDAQDKQNKQASSNYQAFRKKMNEYEQKLDILELRNENLEREIRSIKAELRGQRPRAGPYPLRAALQRTPSNRSIN